MESNLNPIPYPMEANISALFSSPQPRKEFVDDLSMKLYFQYLELKSTPIVINPSKERWFLSLRRKFQARPILLILSILIAMLVLTGVVYAVSRLSGYIPGFGFANSNQSVYVLDVPVKQDVDQIIFELIQAVSDENKTWVKVQVENLPEESYFSSAYLRLDDGTLFERNLGQTEFLDGVTTLTYSFASLPGETTRLTLVITDLLDSAVEIPFSFRPIREGEMLPVVEMGDYPLYSEVQQGLQLSLDYVAPASDRTIFQVSVHFDQEGTIIVGPWTVSLQDKNGMIYPLTEITPSNMDRNKSALFQTSTFEGNEKLILRLRNDIPMENKIRILQDYSPNPGKFKFNPGKNPQPGQVWELDEKVQVGEFTLQIIRAELLEGNELSFEFSPHTNVIEVMLYSDEPGFQSASSQSPVENRKFLSTVGFQKLPKEPFDIQIRSVYQTISGEWQLEWTPPAAPFESTTQLFPTATTPAMITPTATIEIEGDLYQRVKTLSDQFDAPYQQGPGWVHIITEQLAKVEEGQVLPPPYLKSDEWYEINADGNIERSLYTEYSDGGTIIQQVATIGNYSVNFSFGGGGYNELSPRKISLDRLNESFQHADEDNSEISGEEIDCQDGKRCLLIKVQNNFEHPMQFSGNEKPIIATSFKVWVDLSTGLQFKFDSVYLYEDGSEEVRTTRQVLQVDKVEQAPAEVVGILDRVVLP